MLSSSYVYRDFAQLIYTSPSTNSANPFES